VPTPGRETFELRLDELSRAGFYRLDYVEAAESGRPAEPPTVLAVNVDPAESDLARLRHAAFATAFPPEHVRVLETIETGDRTAEAAPSDAVWWWVLWAVMAAMLAESYLAQRFGRARQGGVA
jgi:hypothetical protein